MEKDFELLSGDNLIWQGKFYQQNPLTPKIPRSIFLRTPWKTLFSHVVISRRQLRISHMRNDYKGAGRLFNETYKIIMRLWEPTIQFDESFMNEIRMQLHEWTLNKKFFADLSTSCVRTKQFKSSQSQKKESTHTLFRKKRHSIELCSGLRIEENRRFLCVKELKHTTRYEKNKNWIKNFPIDLEWL